MIQQPSINQELQVNKLYLKSAVIKSVTGKNVTIEWAVPDREEMTRTFLDRENIEEVSDLNTDIPKLESADEEIKNSESEANKGNKQEAIQNDTSPEQNESQTNKQETALKEQDNKKVDKALEKQGGKQAESDDKKNQTSADNNSKQKGIVQKNINTYYGIATNEAFNIQLGVGGKIDKNGKWVNASASQIKKYFVPSEANINQYKYQFLNLASLAGISESEAKEYLKNKGILSGKEATFIEAAKANNINEIYLMAHACLETGNGKSKLATGVNYKGTVVYNMFGIHAYDSDPIGQGSAYAYKMGWTTPEKAILGGAKFISTNYINNFPYNQDTLYEMRWNPANPGDHQYATDIAWAIKQAAWIEKIYSTFESATVTFDIPIYRK